MHDVVVRHTGLEQEPGGVWSNPGCLVRVGSSHNIKGRFGCKKGRAQRVPLASMRLISRAIAPEDLYLVPRGYLPGEIGRLLPYQVLVNHWPVEVGDVDESARVPTLERVGVEQVRALTGVTHEKPKSVTNYRPAERRIEQPESFQIISPAKPSIAQILVGVIGLQPLEGEGGEKGAAEPVAAFAGNQINPHTPRFDFGRIPGVLKR